MGIAIGVGAGLAAAGTAVAAGGMSVNGQKPGYSYYGGSQGAYNAYQQQYGQGAAQGGQMAQGAAQGLYQGVGYGPGGAYDPNGGAATQANTAGVGAGAQYAQLGQQYQGQMQSALQSPQQFAQVYGQSQHASDAAFQAQIAQNANNNLALARSGPNNAGSIRTALATNSSQGLQAQANANVARAQEQTAFNQQYAGMQQNAQLGAMNSLAGQQQYAGNMQQGMLGLQNQYAQTASGTGTALSGQYLNALGDANNAQLQASQQTSLARAQAQQNKSHNYMALGTSLIGAGGSMMASGASK